MTLLAARPVRLLLLGIAATTMLVGASTPLNPLVVRAPAPRGSVPADCEQSLSPTPPQRVEQRDVRDIPLPQAEPAEAVAPPSSSLRAALQATQNALVRNDRPEFNRSLETARSILARYPTGAERRAGEELLRIYDATARLWDAQFESPFFDQSSPEYALVSGYPGYAESVRRSTITDASGSRFYPAAESREFLARIASDRLRGIGITTTVPPRVARATPPAIAAPTPDVPPARPRNTQPRETIARNNTRNDTRNTTPSRTTRSTRTTTRHTTPTSSSAHTTPTNSTARTPKPRRPTTTEVPQPRLASGSSGASTAAPRTPARVNSTPSAPNPSAAPDTAAAPSPATPMTATTTSPAPPPPAVGTSTATASTDTAQTDTTPAADTATDVTDTAFRTFGTETGVATGTTPATADTHSTVETPSRTRSVVLPTILILIGLGVLIVLFRASK